MLNWNSQRVLNNSSSLQPERHVPLTFKTKQNLLLKRQHSAHTKKTSLLLQASRQDCNICHCSQVCQNAADSERGKIQNEPVSKAVQAAGRRRRCTRAVPSCSSAQSIGAHQQAGAAAPGALVLRDNPQPGWRVNGIARCHLQPG